MPKETVSSTVTITGSKRQVSELLTLLRYVQYLGGVGHSTSFKVSVDGDGAARIKVAFEDEHLEDNLLSVVKSRMNRNGDIESFGLN